MTLDEIRKGSKYPQSYLWTALADADLDEYGIWEVRGEDENADLAGPHYEPVIAHMRGYLEEVIVRAITLPEFWTWGSGGSFTRIHLEDVSLVPSGVPAGVIDV